MSCPNCEELQDSNPFNLPEIFIRVGTGNVQIIACNVHAKALIDTYKKGLEQLEKEHDGTHEF